MIYADGCTDAAVAAFGAAVKTPLQRGGGQVHSQISGWYMAQRRFREMF